MTEETMKMNRKAMVLAVGAALAAPCAHAQLKSPAGSDWEFYGKVYPEALHISSSGATQGAAPATIANASGPNAMVNRNEMLTGNSYLGFRGKKDMGAGLKGIWQLESQMTFDDATGVLNQRDSFAGLEAKWGTVRLGNMDTPFKKFGDTLGFLGVSSGNFVSTSNVFRKAGFGGSSSSSFNLRRANSVMYDSPTFGGIQAEVLYSVGDPLENAITGSRKPVVWSGGIKYEVGPLYLAAAHEIHNDLYGGSRNVPQTTISNLTINASGAITAGTDNVRSKDRATQLTAQYKVGPHTIEADYIRKKYRETGPGIAAGHFNSYTNNAFLVSVESRWSNTWRTQAHVVKALKGKCGLEGGATCDTSGLDGVQYSVGASYYVDPAFYVFGLYAILKNGASAQYNNASGQQGTPNPGEDIRQMAVGIAYNF